MEPQRKGTAEMLGEACREVAVLIFVFAPLDRWVERQPYMLSDLWKSIGSAVILFAVGIVIERVRT